MRDISYRAKRKDNGEWVYGVPLKEGYSQEVEMLWYEYGSLAYTERVQVIPETVGQYTGLTDKNGKKIFEGDIVICHHKIYLDEWNAIDGIDEKGVVCFKHGCFIMLDDYKYEKSGGKFLVSSKYENYEVIGNLYDNPELLEVK